MNIVNIFASSLTAKLLLIGINMGVTGTCNIIKVSLK